MLWWRGTGSSQSVPAQLAPPLTTMNSFKSCAWRSPTHCQRERWPRGRSATSSRLRVAYLLTDAAPQRRPCVDPLHSFPLLRPAVLTFGYYDASTLIYWLKGFGAVFQDAFEKEFMYLHTRLDRVPTVNVLCAVLSIINMNFVIRRDFVGTLRSCILGFKTHRHIREGEPPVRAALHSWLNVFLPVYCGITVRAILLPAYTACAAPLAFRGATAADIVLSSMSLSFLFDLDDMLYGYLLSSRQRGIYEGSMAQFQSHHFTLGFKERRLIGLYAWSLWALDVAWMICYYLTLVGYDVIGLPFAIRNDGRHDDDLAPIAVVRFERVQIMPWW